MLLGLVVLGTSALADNDWVYGTWWYAHANGQILEGDDKDGMIFRRDGTVDLIDENAKTWLTCHYRFQTAIQINLDCTVRGESRQLRFLVNADRSRLAGVEDTDNGFYRR